MKICTHHITHSIQQDFDELKETTLVVQVSESILLTQQISKIVLNTKQTIKGGGG